MLALREGFEQMSRQREADSLWSIMEQSEWWKQYSGMVNEEKTAAVPAEEAEFTSALGSWPVSGHLPTSGLLPVSLPVSWSALSSGSAAPGSSGFLGYGLQLL